MPASLLSKAGVGEEMRSLVEETGKLIFSTESFTINVWPWVFAAIGLLVGKNKRKSVGKMVMPKW